MRKIFFDNNKLFHFGLIRSKCLRARVYTLQGKAHTTLHAINYIHLVSDLEMKEKREVVKTNTLRHNFVHVQQNNKALFVEMEKKILFAYVQGRQH